MEAIHTNICGPAIHYECEKVHLTDAIPGTNLNLVLSFTRQGLIVVAMESAGVTLVKGDLRGIACTSLSN
jgi:hypothetical protein